jgi:hypothetical protein
VAGNRKRAPQAAPLSSTFVVGERDVSLPSEDTERLLTGLERLAAGRSQAARAARRLMTRMQNPDRIGLFLRAVDVQPGEHGVLLAVLDRLEPKNARLVRLERFLRAAGGQTTSQRRTDS